MMHQAEVVALMTRGWRSAGGTPARQPASHPSDEDLSLETPGEDAGVP